MLKRIPRDNACYTLVVDPVRNMEETLAEPRHRRKGKLSTSCAICLISLNQVKIVIVGGKKLRLCPGPL